MPGRYPLFRLHWMKWFSAGLQATGEVDNCGSKILAIVPATPSSKDGLCGTEQAKRSQLQLPVVLVYTTGEARDARPPSTVDRLSSVVPDGKQGTIPREARQCPHLFVCTEHECANRSCSPQSKALWPRVFECSPASGPEIRSSSAYVPSACEAGPHAHPL